MLNNNLEDFSQRLILSEQHFITSTGVFKRAILTGYLSILVISICLFYILFDAYLGLLNAFYYYFVLIILAGIAFSLNRSGRYEFAKLVLLISTTLIIFLFSSTEPVENGNYFNFFPLTVAAFALFDYKEIYKGVIITLFSIGVFLVVYFYELHLLPMRPVSEGSEVSNFLIHYLISIFATVVVIVFLIKLNWTIEINLIKRIKT